MCAIKKWFYVEELLLNERGLKIDLRPSRPGLDLSKERVSGARCGDVLSVTQKSVGGGETSPIASADDEGLSGV